MNRTGRNIIALTLCTILYFVVPNGNLMTTFDWIVYLGIIFILAWAFPKYGGDN